MRRLAYIFVGIVFLTLVFLGLSYAALNSSAASARIESSLSTYLGAPVKLGGVSVGIFPTPALDARDVRIGNADSGSAPDDSLRNPKGDPTITTITDVQATLEAAGGSIKARDFSGRLGTTSVGGSAEAGSKGATLHLSSESIENADPLSLSALATIEPYPDLSISRKAPFELTTTVAPDFKTFVATGKASYSIRGSLRGLDVNRALKETRFQSFSASAAIGGGKARTDDLQLLAGSRLCSGARAPREPVPPE